MAFPIIPKKRSGATGNPSSLNLGELAVNTFTGELFLGADGGVTLLNGPVAGGTTTTEATGDGTTTAFTFAGFNGTADGGYLVSVGGIDQPPSKYSVTDTAGGTLTFVEAPTDGELISIRAIVAGSGGGGSGDATSLQGRALSDAIPDDKMCITWVESLNQWQPSFPQSADAVTIQSRAVANTLPTDGQVLGWDETNATWEPVNPNDGSDATSLQGSPIVVELTPSPLDVLTWAQINTGGGSYEWRARPLGGNNTPLEGQTLVFSSTSGWQPGDINAVKLQGQGISSSAPASGNLLRFDGTDWVPFDGIAIPNWNTSNFYYVNDKVVYDGKIWAATNNGSNNTPSTGSAWWAENIGSNSGTPSNQSTPAYWLRITTLAGDGHIPIYV